MADEQDSASKTEQATERKLSEAAKRGELPRSQEINHWFVLASGTLAIGMFAATGSQSLTAWMSSYISNATDIALAPNNLVDLARGAGFEILRVLALPFVIMILGCIAGELVQHAPVFSAERITPRFSKVSPIKGLSRLFSPRALAEFVKGILKIIIAGAATVYAIWPDRNRLADLADVPIGDLVFLALTLTLRMFAAALVVVAAIAVLDYFYQRFTFMQQQRMTRRELFDEMKAQEGDPIIKGRLRQLRMERARRRMMAAVPTADVVITNPTHYAVALKYDQASMQAPKVVAKGVDALAARIRELATENEVPLVENPPLARTLHAAVEVDQEILPEHYRAVAEVIGYVMKLRSRMRSRGPVGGPPARR
jgi:flagellar biosynthetic protein FlhB